MGDYKRVIILALIMAGATAAVLGVTFWLLYNTAFEEQRLRLINMAQSSARMMESVANFDKEHSVDYPEGAVAATISQIKASHQEFEGFGKTGEFTLARREGDQIIFIVGHRHHDLDEPHPVPFDALKAEPMRRALAGLSGTVIAPDYRGETVLAAYEPVAVLNLGVVAKIDLVEIRAPFVKAGGIIMALALVLIITGTVLFFRLGDPLIRALRQSRAQYRGIAQDHPEMICRFLPDGTLTFVNDSFCRFFGKTREELIGQAFTHLVDEEDLENVEEKVESLSKDNPVTIIKNRVIAAGGEIRWTRWANQAIWDDEGHVIEYQSGGHDITEQVEAQEALRNSEERFRDFADAASDWFWETGADLRFSYFSEQAADRLGISPDKLIGKTRREIGQVGPNVEDWEAHLADLDAHRPFRDFQYEIKHGNFVNISGIPVFDNEGEFLGYRGTGRSIIERRRAEQRLSDAIESISEGFVLYDKDDRLVICNSKYKEIYKVSAEAIVPGATFEEIVRSAVEHDLIVGAREQGEKFIEERVFKHQNPTEVIEQQLSDGRWLRIAERKTKDGGIVGIRADITQLKNAEAELIEHRDNLEELVEQRTSEVQEKAIQLESALEREKEYNALQKKFVALVSHEFRTPLSIIDGTAQRFIRRKDSLDANEIETRANKIRSAVTRMIGLIDTTLYASRMDAGKIEMQCTWSDIGELLLDVCERQAEISPDHQFNVEVEKLPKEMWFDRKLLDHVFTNFLSNAVKYAPQAPHIEVKGWQENEDAVIAIITVTDHGVGIPKDELPHMFGRFFRASTAEGIKGTGLGLSVCKEFIEMHGGTIEVVSVEGEGSTFTVRLPIHRQDYKDFGSGV